MSAFVTESVLSSLSINGYAVLPGVFSQEESQAVRTMVHAVAAEGRNIGRPGEIIVGLSLENPLTHSLLLSQRLGEIAAHLLEVDAVRLLYGRIYIKLPGAPSTDWHQDLCYFPLDTDRVVTLWIPLLPITTDSSPLRYAVGSHREGFLALGTEAEARERFPIVEICPLRAGDMCAHIGWMLHGAAPHTGTSTREAVGLSYFADGAALLSLAELQANPYRWQEIRQYVESPEYRPGELLANAAVPLVYQRKQLL